MIDIDCWDGSVCGLNDGSVGVCEVQQPDTLFLPSYVICTDFMIQLFYR